jgi:hypothetical protein
MNCSFCNKNANRTRVLLSHERNCKLNPNKTIIKAKFRGNQYTKAKELGLPKPVINSYKPTELEKESKRKSSTLFNRKYWTEDKRAEHSKRMQKVVEQNPESYTKENVSGRVRLFEIVDGLGNLTKVKGSWELSVAKWLNEHSVKWKNNIDPFPYFWNGTIHKYFPDFYIMDFDVFIEVKGYETERDRCKWLAMTEELLIIKEKEYKNLDEVLNKFTIAG